jgi:DNA-binding Lrp family transcriptional regulator
MYIPSITSIENALKIYYENSEIGNKEIKILFGCKSYETISRLKKLVKMEMLKREIPTFNAYKVNTAIAYEVWGIVTTDLENRMKKIKELSL